MEEIISSNGSDKMVNWLYSKVRWMEAEFPEFKVGFIWIKVDGEKS